MGDARVTVGSSEPEPSARSRVHFAEPRDQDTSFFLYLVDTKVDGLRSEMKGEIATVMATIREAEAQRSNDYKELTRAIDDITKNLPTTATIKSVVRNWALLLGGFLLALMTLVWATFDTGAGIAGSFADQVLETKGAAQKQEERDRRLDRALQILEEPRNDNATRSAPEGNAH